MKTEQTIADELALNIKYKLETLKVELTNIAYAIHWNRKENKIFGKESK